jgi:hypothetical protein
MKIILVMLNNKQEYILDNIKNLLKYGNNDIIIITDKKFNHFFNNKDVNIINIEDLLPNYIEYTSTIENTFRNGFWQLTSFRFIAINAYMNENNIQNIIHIENDVLIYTDIDNIKFHNTNKILLTMDSKNRCIPGIMFIPNHKILKKCLDMFNPKLNDMDNFALCYYKLTEYIDTLPIFIENNTNSVTNMISKNYKYYNSIFDAAAIGQYLGGIDPKNKSGDTTCFVNETCVINYSHYKFKWKNKNGLIFPVIIIDNTEIPIINLHIHCKDLKKFI